MAKIDNKLTKDFTTLPNALIQDETLSDRARFLFVYMATKPNDWDFYQKPLCKGLGWSADTFRKYMAELIEKGWITFEGQQTGNGNFSANRYTIHSFPCQEKTVSENFRCGKNPTHTKERPRQKKDSNKDIVGKPDIASKVDEIIAHLNDVTGSKYRASSKATKRLISARLNEGYTVADFKKVIDTMSVKWKGDPKMADYLRPLTLFSTKFESYLNASTTTSANSDNVLRDEKLEPALQNSYNNYITFVQTQYPALYRSECRILTHSEYRRMVQLTDQPGAFVIPIQQRKRLLDGAHKKLNTDSYQRKKYAAVYDLYKEAIRAELKFEKSPI